MKIETVSIPVNPDESVSGILAAPDTLNHNSTTALVFAHGMANDMNHPSIAGVAEGLATLGFITLRFNFPYREKKRKSADPEPKLINAWQSAITFLRERPDHAFDTLVAVGKSLGGRIASKAVASGAITPDRLMFLGYPLHAPGRKEKLQDAHLYNITVPMLFFEGTRDPFCDLALLAGVFDKLTCPRDLEIIENGDHSFNLPKSDPREEAAVHHQVVEKCQAWLQH
ncbi:MAG: dienelactone hydrolase family protein [Desulfobacterium sp.]|nr:dienelactone hydrolase family protein [Desulfobacterium sp.]